MRNTLIILIILSLAAGWVSNLVAGGYRTPLAWTRPVVCGGGEYAFHQVTGRTLDEFGQPVASTDLAVSCVEGGVARDVIGQARRVLLGYWTAAYFLVFGFWAIILARRARQNAAAGAL